MKIAKLMGAFSLITCIASPSLAQTGNAKLLGIPFGARISISACPVDTWNVTRPCWIREPHISSVNGSLVGLAHIPDPNSRPAWAAYADFALSVDRSGVVDIITVSVSPRISRQEIIDSISLRFGKPLDHQRVDSNSPLVNWRSAEGAVNMVCHRDCQVSFMTPAAKDAFEAKVAEMLRKEANRPKAP